MLTLITGTPGAGKSLRVMWWLQQPEYAGREVYSNIPGTDHHPLPEGNDWRKTPEGSVIVYDEAQQFWPATGRAGTSDDPVVTALETHRHTGHDLIFVTQRYALLHVHIRSLVGRYEWITRKSKKLAVIFSAGEVFDPRDRRKLQTVTEEAWRYPTDLFDKYDSASLHTEAQTRTRIPTKLKVLAVVILGLLSVAGYAGYQSFTNIGHVDTLDAAAQGEGVIVSEGMKIAGTSASQTKEPTPAWAKKGVEGLSGCIASETGCRCFDSKGLRVDLPEGVCRHQVEQPMVSRITGFDSAQRKRSDPDS